MLMNFLFVFCSMAVILEGAIYDSGYIEVTQPNKEFAFMMRYITDDFYWHMTTLNGYAVIQEPDGYSHLELPSLVDN